MSRSQFDSQIDFLVSRSAFTDAYLPRKSFVLVIHVLEWRVARMSRDGDSYPQYASAENATFEPFNNLLVSRFGLST
jgi:hypothetical protein